ncbi:MAG TPA: hypothetical protein VGJ70_11910 [Solirubrobacteraceae bacterium]
MSVIDDVRRRLAGGGDPGANAPAPEDEPTRELRARRDELADRVAELTFDLGGLTYEMAIRDHFRLEVLVRRAAALQAVDAELAEAERLLRLGESGAAGTCRACGALHSRGASYCWKCGTPLLEGVSAT